MKEFILKSLFFLLTPLIVLYPLDVLVSNKLKETNLAFGEFGVWNDIYDDNAEAEIEIMGSSRAWVHIDPEILEDSLSLSAYNFGVDGHVFISQYYRHLEFLKYNLNPKYIILSLDVASLSKKEGLHNMEQFLPYMLWNSDQEKYLSVYEGFTSLEYKLPFLRYIRNSSILSDMFNEEIKQKMPLRKKGYEGQVKEWSSNFIKTKEQMKHFELKLDSNAISLFENFIEDCKVKSIPLVLVYSPEYIEGQQFMANRSDVIDLYDEYVTKYDLLFLNYSNDSLCNDQSNFYNTTHLNKTGAELFTKKMSHDIKMNGVGVE